MNSICVCFIIFISLCWASCPTDILCEAEFNRCYKFIENKKDFYSAEDHCISLGGHLVSIRNAFEQAIVEDTAESMYRSSSDYWIGLNHLQGNDWTWTDGTPFQYKNWFPGQPSTLEAVSASIGKGYWISSPEITLNPFVCGLPYSNKDTANCPSCQTYSTVAPAPCACTTTTALTTTSAGPSVFPTGWTPFDLTKSCYKVLLGQTFANAEQACSEKGAHLASIDSQEENDFIAELSQTGLTVDATGQTWIGLYKGGSAWYWTNSSTVNFLHWAQGEPSTKNPQDSCVFLYTDKSSTNPSVPYYRLWANSACSQQQRAAVCKKPQ